MAGDNTSSSTTFQPSTGHHSLADSNSTISVANTVAPSESPYFPTSSGLSSSAIGSTMSTMASYSASVEAPLNASISQSNTLSHSTYAHASYTNSMVSSLSGSLSSTSQPSTPGTLMNLHPSNTPPPASVSNSAESHLPSSNINKDKGNER